MEDNKTISFDIDSVYNIFSGAPLRKDFLTVKNWGMMFHGQPYRPKDRTFIVLIGEVDGVPITSERLIVFNKVNSYCQSASQTYRLEGIDPYFERWMAEKELTLEVFERIIK